MVDTNKLIERIQKKGLAEAKLAEKLGISNHVFHDKLNGIGKCFTIKEVHKLVQILNLEGSDAERIFLQISRILCDNRFVIFNSKVRT